MFYQGQRLQCSWLRHEDITKLWRWSRSFSLPHTFHYFRCSSDSLTPTFSSRTNSTRQFSTWCWKPDTTTRFSHRPCWLTPLSSDLGARGRVRSRERADHLHPAQRQQHAGEARDEVDHQPSWLKRQHSSPLRKALSKPGHHQVYAPVTKSSLVFIRALFCQEWCESSPKPTREHERDAKSDGRPFLWGLHGGFSNTLDLFAPSVCFSKLNIGKGLKFTFFWKRKDGFITF